MRYKAKSSSNKKPRIIFVIIGSIILILLACSYYFLAIKNNRSTDKTAETESNEKVDLSPPTDKELKETEEFKKNLANNPQSPSDGLGSVIPTIGYLQQTESLNIESNGFISGIAETGGTCTLTLEKDGTKVTESRQAMPDAQGMICGHMIVSRDRLSQGSWKAYISYTSSKYTGVSEQRVIEVK